ncbi:MAG: biotin transport system substrate-specific component [Paracoccaceae bacterium]|jgi:biotin transport system substrate-specific component
MTHETVLMRQFVRSSTDWRNVALILFGSAIIAIAAQISVPMFPVPMTMQTLAISVIGLTFGARLAGLTLLAYLAEGALGLPVFANGSAGLLNLMGPTSGFLWGFVGMAFLTGWMAERGFSRGAVRLFFAAFIPATLLFIPGVLGLWALTPLDFSGAFNAGVLPFLVGDVVKSVLATLVVVGGLAAVKKRKES